MAAPTVILGAGLAGLSLARALIRERPGAEVVLVDRRTAWEHDRTWCFWAVPAAGTEAASASWTAWRTVTAAGEVIEQRSADHPYVHVPADRFYERALDELDAAPGVEILAGTRVLDVTGSVVATSAGDVAASAVVDAMGGGGPLLRGRPPGAVELRQRFLGVEVEAARPVFDPDAATLMDFRVPAVDGGVRFAYVLPFSRTRALVEDTTIGGPVVSDAARRTAIAEYLGEVLGAGDVEVLREERGVLPMSTHRFAAAPEPGRYAVGQAAGAARPSSGYAFVRTQRQAGTLARTLVHGIPLAALDPPRRRCLDDLFLRALAASPQLAPGWFAALARRVPGDVFARFMADASTTLDDARVVAALASPRFLAAMAGAPAAAALASPRVCAPRAGASRRAVSARDPAPAPTTPAAA